MKTDTRLLRPHPDLLPTHRHCPGCSETLPLTKDHFYETNRYRWNLSRFAPSCIACCKLADRVRYAERKTQRNSRRAERIRIVRADVQRVGAEAYAECQAANVALSIEQQAQRERTAALKRGILRKYGPRPDGIKLMIAERSRMYAEHRMSSGAEPCELRQAPRDNSDLEVVRARHRAEAANPQS